MNKQILLSLSVIAIVATVVVGGTVALFSDTEKVTANTFAAGTIDIAIDGENAWATPYTIGDLKPGEVGYINFRINNVGMNPVEISKTLLNIVGDGGITGYTCGNYSASSEPECVAEDDGNAPNDDVQTQIIYDLSVEVYNQANELIWWQAIYEESEAKSLAYVYGPQGGTSVYLGVIPVDGYMMVTQSYHFDYQAGNEYQGDGLTFDMEIVGMQLTGESGYATVALENKSGEPEWDIFLGDGVEGTLDYKTQGPLFDYTFSGLVNIDGNYTLLYVGSTNDYPGVGSVDLGGGAFFNKKTATLSGQVDTGDITDGKVWLIPSSSYDGDVMITWPLADILFEIGLVNYDKN